MYQTSLNAALTCADRCIVTLLMGVVAKYYDEYVCLSVSLSVCLSDRISPEPYAQSLPIFFVHVAYVRGSVLLQHDYDRPHLLSPGRDFLPH